MRPEAVVAIRALKDLTAEGPDGPGGPALVHALRMSGLLEASVHLAHQPDNPSELLEILVSIGEVSLSAGRLFEGHINAAKLITLHRPSLFPALSAGQLLGIWGADGQDPARIEDGVIRGQKIFASGADTVDHAIVSVQRGDLPQLLLFSRAQLKDRLFPEEWDVSGMKATASGRCDLNGLRVSDAVQIGDIGAYLNEPHFQGGVWRYAAVQLGAMKALTRMTARQLEARRQSSAPIQSQRLRRMVSACETSRLWLQSAAHAVEGAEARASDANTAVLARLVVAEEAQIVMMLADQAMGAASYATAHPAERIRRDLGFYLRQANPDILSQKTMDRILADPLLRERWDL